MLVNVPWRATPKARQEWQNTLQTRIDQQQAMIDAWRSAISATEETLPALRDALVMATDAVGVNLDGKAKWVTDNLLIDAKNHGCAMTTRIAQAIETIQSLLFGVRTALLPKARPTPMSATFKESTTCLCLASSRCKSRMTLAFSASLALSCARS